MDREEFQTADVRMSTAVERRSSLAVIATWSDIGPSAAGEISGGLTKLPADVFAQELRPADFAAFAEEVLLDPRVLIGGTIVCVSCPRVWRCIA
ncbi:MAG: DNA-binding protein [Edaphobacter sp.]|nr:DNA-binding protein [Edaphobacter sp.]